MKLRQKHHRTISSRNVHCCWWWRWWWWCRRVVHRRYEDWHLRLGTLFPRWCRRCRRRRGGQCKWRRRRRGCRGGSTIIRRIFQADGLTVRRSRFLGHSLFDVPSNRVGVGVIHAALLQRHAYVLDVRTNNRLATQRTERLHNLLRDDDGALLVVLLFVSCRLWHRRLLGHRHANALRHGFS